MNKKFRVFGKRSLLLMICFGSVILFGMIGCDRMTRYEILTFFFEGVPEPNSKRITPGADANGVAMTNVQKQNLEKGTEQPVNVKKTGQKVPSSHEVARDCTNCHMGDLRSGRQELKQPLPALCYSCHPDIISGDAFVHGPLNVGDCLFCHDPHQSKYIHLQKAPQPQLCYRCHQKENIAVIPGHSERLEDVCTDCHDPHGGSTLQLLKPGWDMQNGPNTMDNANNGS